MATIVTDCPHCGATHAAFVLAFAQPSLAQQGIWNVFAACPACSGPLTGRILCPSHAHNPMTVPTMLVDANGYRILETFPIPQKSPTPEHIPPATERAYEQGVRCLIRGDYTPAAAMFRRCLEVALKAHSPEVEAWKLEKRIDKLASERKITEDLKTWAHRVRLDGNDALHEEEEFTKETATELMEFTRLLLTYLYTLPEKIRLRLATAE
ncbi:DUF4145 domain-containing protein [Burkholderia ubonensis]|uniref:DUF4145 domain-containing protein n=1 Tax=Burkholderia ubonensis TaxID=101571 RepID=UPI001E522A52|nr:DUF4145 domain-containing protein [Burkholderia ubonensis]